MNSMSDNKHKVNLQQSHEVCECDGPKSMVLMVEIYLQKTLCHTLLWHKIRLMNMEINLLPATYPHDYNYNIHVYMYINKCTTVSGKARDYIMPCLVCYHATCMYDTSFSTKIGSWQKGHFINFVGSTVPVYSVSILHMCTLCYF